MNDAIDKALRAPHFAPVLHKLKVSRPRQRRRPVPVKIAARLPMNDADSRVPDHVDRLQIELQNHFEHYGVPVQERNDLLKVLGHPEADLAQLKYSSARGLRGHVEKDGFCDMPLEKDLWEGEFNLFY